MWCATTFVTRRGPGRQRIYCKRSCRQRAYERRRGLGVLPPPEVLIAIPGGPLGHLPERTVRYEAGGYTFSGKKSHALRPGGYADAFEQRPTLCGLRRAPTGRPFVFIHDRTCRTCDAVATLRPSRRSMRVSNDLAAYRTQLDNVATRLARARVDLRDATAIPPVLAAQLLGELLDAA